MSGRDFELVDRVARVSEAAYGHILGELKQRIASLEHKVKEQQKQIVALERGAPTPPRPRRFGWFTK